MAEVYQAGTPITPTIEGGSMFVFEPASKGAEVVTNGLAEVV